MKFENQAQTLDLIMSHLWDEHVLGMLPIPPDEWEALVEGALLLWPSVQEVLEMPVSAFPTYIAEGREPLEGERVLAISAPRGGAGKGHSGHPESFKIEKKGEKAGFGGNKVNVMELEIVREPGAKGKPAEPVMEGIQEGSKPLRNLNHERFAVLVATEGKPDSVAYREAYQCSIEAAEDHAWKLRRDSGVERRIVYLMEKVSLAKVLTAQEAREFLASVVRTPVGEVNEFSPLAQEVVYEESEKGSRTKIKMVDKLGALKTDADLGGYALAPAGNTPGLRLRVVATSAGIAAEMNGV